MYKRQCIVLPNGNIYGAFLVDRFLYSLILNETSIMISIKLIIN